MRGYGRGTRLSLERFLDKAAELGFAGIMLMAKRPHLSVLDYEGAECARLRERLEQKGLRCSVIAGYNNFSADLEHGDVPHREIQIQHVTELARLARDLGAGVVRIFTAYEHPASSYAALWNMLGGDAPGVRAKGGRVRGDHRRAEPPPPRRGRPLGEPV